MFSKDSGEFKLLFPLLFCSFISVFIISNIYADESKDHKQEMVLTQVQEENTVPSEDYRQRLGEVITVVEEKFTQELDSYVRFMPLAGAKSQSGKVGLVASATEYSYQAKAFDKLPVELAVGSKYIGINNSTAVELPARLTTVSFGLQTILPFFNIDKTYFTIGLAPTFSTDNWNFRTNSFHLAQRYFMIYQPTEKLTVICGAEYLPGFKPAVSPIVGVIYKPNERLAFNLIPDNPEISYELDKRWTVFAQGDYTAEEYRVTQNNLKNVVLNYNEMRLGGGLRCALNKNIKGSLAVGSAFNRSIEYRQDSLGKVALNNGFYSEFRLDIVM